MIAFNVVLEYLSSEIYFELFLLIVIWLYNGITLLLAMASVEGQAMRLWTSGMASDNKISALLKTKIAKSRYSVLLVLNAYYLVHSVTSHSQYVEWYFWMKHLSFASLEKLLNWKEILLTLTRIKLLGVIKSNQK